MNSYISNSFTLFNLINTIYEATDAIDANSLVLDDISNLHHIMENYIPEIINNQKFALIQNINYLIGDLSVIASNKDADISKELLLISALNNHINKILKDIPLNEIYPEVEYLVLLHYNQGKD